MNSNETTASGDSSPIGLRIGPYRVLAVLGEGGMGVVYLAEQDEPIKRRVALKLIKLGMDSHEVVARFESERQALALMTHPNIAKVFDAGRAGDGRPYFVMEYVPGIPITEYCNQERLTNRSRLELIIPVCEALHHAHQKGIVHRDVKPSNILVSVQDGRPVPRIIDFGIAKALNQRLAEATVFTQFGLLIGTPEYMSPEQAGVNALDIDTTSDVYSLGVVLYQLLVGALPFEATRLRDAGFDEIRRIIREEEVVRPSKRLTGMGDEAVEVSRLHQTDTRTLHRELRGDLDWVALKAMEKDRTRRYSSASEFAADIRRHLADEPVVARPPSFSYRASKLLRKHRVASIAAVLGVTASTFVSIAIQTQILLTATASRMIGQAQLVQQLVFQPAKAAAARNSGPWPEALTNDAAVHGTVESAVVVEPVMLVAICDTNRRVIVANRNLEECPSGRPVNELRAVSILTVLRGTVPSETDQYLSTLTFSNRDSGQEGKILVVLSGILMAKEFRVALSRAVLLCFAQLLAVIIVAAVTAWFVFRRG